MNDPIDRNEWGKHKATPQERRTADSARSDAIVEERFSPVLRTILDVYRGDKRIPIPQGQRKR